MHGGTIIVESKKGKGSTFKIELPFKTIETSNGINLNKIINQDNKIEMINIEFSDIYDNGW